MECKKHAYSLSTTNSIRLGLYAFEIKISGLVQRG